MNLFKTIRFACVAYRNFPDRLTFRVAWLPELGSLPDRMKRTKLTFQLHYEAEPHPAFKFETVETA